ncbi:MAG: transglutaminase-like domain-containing protein [Bacteroidales bacterium]|nr:transglutaminase-like domain-containing protein [Bacteroidales bacterium]
MKKSTLLFVITFFFLSFSCKNQFSDIPREYRNLLTNAFEKSGDNKAELQKVLQCAPSDEKEGMAFLISYMPQIDLKHISAELLLDNCHYAYLAKEFYSWAQSAPDSIFLNYVLPYYCLDERRDNWRGDFFERFSKYVSNSDDIASAIQKINNNVRGELGVEYSAKRKKANQSPYESLEIGIASCSGLSILLVDAFRSVGIPARIAGAPLWYDESGNHNWVEVWIDGDWRMTEYYPDPKGLDTSWVIEKAGQCDPNSRKKAIYAASFRPTGISFPLAWDSTISWVYATNVSDRYIKLLEAEKTDRKIGKNESMVKIWVLNENAKVVTSSNRISSKVDIFEDNKIVASGYSPDYKRDMNDLLHFILEREKPYVIKYVDASGREKRKDFEVFNAIDTILLY